jgi:hypothetical protein
MQNEQQRESANRKIGDQALKAMASLGLEELRNGMYMGSNVAQSSTEPGMWGDRNYGDVAVDRTGNSPLSEMIRQAETAREQREPPEIVQE